MNLSWHNTDPVQVLSRLTYFYRSYCPLLKFSFPDFSLLSFEILTWNVVYEFVMAQNKSSLSFVTLDLFLQELLPFDQFLFSGLFSAVFWDIQLKLCIWMAFDSIQIKFEFRHAWPTFKGVNALFKDASQTFLCPILIYWLEITFWPFWSAVVRVMPLENLLGPVGDLYCFSNTYRMLVGWIEL